MKSPNLTGEGGYQPPSFNVMSKKSIHFQGNVFIELFWWAAMTYCFNLNKYIFEDILILLFFDEAASIWYIVQCFSLMEERSDNVYRRHDRHWEIGVLHFTSLSLVPNRRLDTNPRSQEQKCSVLPLCQRNWPYLLSYYHLTLKPRVSY